MTSTTIGSSPSARDQSDNLMCRPDLEDALQPGSSKSISLKYHPYEQQNVSNPSILPRRSPYRVGSDSFRHALEEPDFGTEERSVWSSRSPVGKAVLPRESNFTCDDAVESPSHSRDQRIALPQLQPKVVVSSDPDERPKTRRGPSGPSAFESLGNPKDKNVRHSRDSPTRKAKFTEGTMNSKSRATASTWSDSEYATSSSEAEDSDGDATPKAAKNRRSGSFDLREFQPPMLTPSAIKRTLFKRRTGKKDRTGERVENVAGAEQTEDEEAKKPRRRLRKSMSRLHFLGEKMRIFGSSSHDLSEQDGHNAATVVQDDKVVLDQRKRKAEAAYAEQFGSKKQKDNTGLVKVQRAADTTVEQSESHGNQKYDSTTVRCRGSTTRSRRTSTGSIFNDQATKQDASAYEHDMKRKPSRRELEVENQRLRALLRESQAAQEQASIHLSDAEPIPPVPPLRIRRRSLTSSDGQPPNTGSDSVNQETLHSTVPPVPPQHPDRRVLGNVSNRPLNRATRRKSFGASSDLDMKELPNDTSNPLCNAPKLIPTPVERNKSLSPRRSLSTLQCSFGMIVEEPENESDEKKRSSRSKNDIVGKENMKNTATVIGVVNSGIKKEEWQWPDDVF